MKFLTFYTDSHKEIYENFFLDSYKKYLSNTHILIPYKLQQISKTGIYETSGFDLTMLEKVRIIKQNIELGSSDLLVYSDCDVQFFDNFDVDLGEYDILFQDDHSPKDTGYCAGFFIAKQNQSVLDFFDVVEKELSSNLDGIIHDQTIISKLIREGYDKIIYGKLPTNEFWTIANSTNGEVWIGQDFSVPPQIIMHHANWTVGLSNKISLLQKVKFKVEQYVC